MSDSNLTRRRLVFAGVNLAIVLAFLVVVVAPLIEHFSDRLDEILDNAAQLAQVRGVTDQAARMTATRSKDGDPYLAASEERVASADLQANLQSLATAKGLSVQAVRGLPGRSIGQARVVSVGIDVEGGLSALRDFVAGIEGQTPFLFVTDLSLRTVADGEEGRMRGSLNVEGVLRNSGGAAPGPLLSDRATDQTLAAAQR